MKQMEKIPCMGQTVVELIIERITPREVFFFATEIYYLWLQ